MADHETTLRTSIVHGLRMRGWSRIEAENEADARIDRLRAEHSPQSPATPKEV